MIPRRTLFCVVWNPAGLCSAEYQVKQDVVLQGIRPRRTSVCHKIYTSLSLFCRVSYPARLGSTGSDTPQDLVLWGLIPRRILFCRVSDPTGKLRPRRIRRKSFESLPFSSKGHFSKIVCMYKLHYPRLIVSMLKEPPILKIVFCYSGLWGKAKKWGLSKETFLTQRWCWHRRVNFEFKYLGEFEVIRENTLECETVFQGKTVEEKEAENFVRLSL